MPVLDADALKTDPTGMAFLRVVLQPGPDDHPADAGRDSLQRFRLAAQSQGRTSPAKYRLLRVQVES